MKEDETSLCKTVREINLAVKVLLNCPKTSTNSNLGGLWHVPGDFFCYGKQDSDLGYEHMKITKMGPLISRPGPLWRHKTIKMAHSLSSSQGSCR